MVWGMPEYPSVEKKKKTKKEKRKVTPHAAERMSMQIPRFLKKCHGFQSNNKWLCIIKPLLLFCWVLIENEHLTMRYCVYVARVAGYIQIHPITYLNMLKHKQYKGSIFMFKCQQSKPCNEMIYLQLGLWVHRKWNWVPSLLYPPTYIKPTTLSWESGP